MRRNASAFAPRRRSKRSGARRRSRRAPHRPVRRGAGTPAPREPRLSSERSDQTIRVCSTGRDRTQAGLDGQHQRGKAPSQGYVRAPPVRRSEDPAVPRPVLDEEPLRRVTTTPTAHSRPDLPRPSRPAGLGRTRGGSRLGPVRPSPGTMNAMRPVRRPSRPPDPPWTDGQAVRHFTRPVTDHNGAARVRPAVGDRGREPAALGGPRRQTRGCGGRKASSRPSTESHITPRSPPDQGYARSFPSGVQLSGTKPPRSGPC